MVAIRCSATHSYAFCFTIGLFSRRREWGSGECFGGDRAVENDIMTGVLAERTGEEEVIEKVTK